MCLLAAASSDMNECLADNGGCQQDCFNNVGSYTCDCNVGYSLAGDGQSCVGKDKEQIKHCSF